MNDFLENKLISVFMYPGQNVPEISPHWWAAAMKKIGRPLRAASTSAVSHVEYHTTPSAPIGCGLAPSSFGLGPLALATELAAFSTPMANIILSVFDKFVIMIELI